VRLLCECVRLSRHITAQVVVGLWWGIEVLLYVQHTAPKFLDCEPGQRNA
jgi:hypothetical protein